MRAIILLISMMTMQTCAAMAETSADVRAALSGFAEQFQLPGVSLTVIEEGEIVEDAAIGFADLELKVPMRTDTLNRIGSISKTMTAAAALKMVASGQIDLDREVSAYLDDFDGPARDVTLRQLMSHTGCVRGYRDGEGISYIHYEDATKPLELFREDPLECVPGARFIYSSYGYALMDAVMVRVSGEDFQSLMKELVWTPLGLERVALDDLRKVISWRARNYDLDAEGRLVNAPYSDSSYKYAGAGMLSSTRDLARFGAALMDGAFVTDEARSEMFAPALLKDGTGTDYGLGLYVDFAGFIEARRAYIPDALYESLMAQASRHKVYWHSGTSEGAVAILMLEPETGRVVALATNRGGVEKEAIVFAMSLITLLGEQ